MPEPTSVGPDSGATPAGPTSTAAQGQLGPDFHQRDEDNIDASRESAAAQCRRIGVDACWCSEDDIEPKYGHADDHILGRTVVTVGPSMHATYPDTASNSRKGHTIHAF